MLALKMILKFSEEENLQIPEIAMLEEENHRLQSIRHKILAFEMHKTQVPELVKSIRHKIFQK